MALASAPHVSSDWSKAAKQRRFYSLGREPQEDGQKEIGALKGRGKERHAELAAPLQGA